VFENVGWGEILVLVVAGLFILGRSGCPRRRRGSARRSARSRTSPPAPATSCATSWAPSSTSCANPSTSFASRCVTCAACATSTRAAPWCARCSTTTRPRSSPTGTRRARGPCPRRPPRSRRPPRPGAAAGPPPLPANAPRSTRRHVTAASARTAAASARANRRGVRAAADGCPGLRVRSSRVTADRTVELPASAARRPAGSCPEVVAHLARFSRRLRGAREPRKVRGVLAEGAREPR